MKVSPYLLIFLWLSGLPFGRAFVQQPQPTPASPAILSPKSGDVLQGKNPITGNTDIAGFLSAELTFAYRDNPTDTWFFIWESRTPLADGVLTHWDTTTLTDGEYTLRLTVFMEDGSQLDATIADLRIRNYTPIETATPTPLTPTATLAPGDTLVPTLTPTFTETPLPPTVTPLPANPAQLTLSKITQSFGKGALGVIGFFALIGLYQLVKKLRDASVSH
jgi:hypothetical protein